MQRGVKQEAPRKSRCREGRWEGSKRKKEALYCGCPSTAYDNTCWLLSVLPKSHWPLWELFSSHSVQNRNTQWIFAFTHSLLENCFPGSPGSVLELEEHHSWTHSLSSTVQLPTWLQAQCPQPQTAFLSSQTALFALQQPAAIETLEISYGMWTQKGHTTVLLTAGRISSGLFDSNPLPKSNALLSEELTWENPKELIAIPCCGMVHNPHYSCLLLHCLAVSSLPKTIYTFNIYNSNSASHLQLSIKTEDAIAHLKCLKLKVQGVFSFKHKLNPYSKKKEKRCMVVPSKKA